MQEKKEATCPWCKKKITYIGLYSTGDYMRYAYSCKTCNVSIEVLQ